ncbi:MAG TPA: CoA-binding protein [Gemmatales bacterium]|nr:CoA-binding protein [Gemmatales bacterium]
MNDAAIKELLENTRTIAVVGFSENADRPSHYVSQYMATQGYRIIPVNPTIVSVLGQRCYASLRDIPEPVDMVNVFRRPEAVPAIVEEALAIGARSLWLQA